MSPTRASGNEAQFERTLTTTGPVTLDISVRSGRVRVRRGENNSVVVRGSVRVRSFLNLTNSHSQAFDLAANPPILQDGNHIEVGDLQDRWLLSYTELQLEILTPAESSVRAFGDAADFRIESVRGPVYCETDSGEIHIEDIESVVNAGCDSGSISILRIAGPIDAHTDSGEILALEIGGRIDARCDSGEISLSQTKVAPIEARTDSGSIRVKLVPDGGYRLRLRTDNGRLEIPDLAQAYASPHEIEGSIRGGGPIVDLATDSGNIEVT
jgi:hypothetical protein